MIALGLCASVVKTKLQLFDLWVFSRPHAKSRGQETAQKLPRYSTKLFTHTLTLSLLCPSFYFLNIFDQALSRLCSSRSLFPPSS
jgi:hypothetical protein